MSSSSNLTNSFSRLAVSEPAPYRYPPRPPQFQGREQFFGYSVSMKYLKDKAAEHARSSEQTQLLLDGRQGTSSALSLAMSWFKARNVSVCIRRVLPPDDTPADMLGPSGKFFIVTPALPIDLHFKWLSGQIGTGKDPQWWNDHYHRDDYLIDMDLSALDTDNDPII